MDEYRVGDVSRMAGNKKKFKDAKLVSLFTPQHSGQLKMISKETSAYIPAIKEAKSAKSKKAVKRTLESYEDTESHVKKKIKSERHLKKKIAKRKSAEKISPSLEVKANQECAEEEQNRNVSYPIPPEQKKRRPKHLPSSHMKPEELEKTVFVGNVPMSFNKQELLKLFKKFGQIDSVRIRSVAVSDLKVSKKVAAIRHQFNPNRDNVNAYVKFHSKDDARKALQMNGYDLKGFHLRVDLAQNSQSYDHHRSIFLGNLPYNITEERVRQCFEECGEIENIRLIRDAKTGVGKGFGYVLFKSADSVQLALRFSNKNLDGREIRVKRSLAKSNSNTQRNQSIKRQQVKGNFKRKQKVRISSTGASFQGSTSSSVDSKGKLQMRKKKRKAKKQKRFN